MAKARIVGSDHPLGAARCAQPMTGWGKVDFLFLPVSWTLIAGPLLIVSAFSLLAFIVALVRHAQTFKEIAPSLLIVGVACIIFGAILAYPIHFFRKMRHRKRLTGSIFPAGEEFAAFRYHREHPSTWKRILLVSFFCLIAFSATHALWSGPYRRVSTNWIIPALLWLIAILVAVDAFIPRSGRRWTGFTASGAFGAIAILAVSIIVHRGAYVSDWVFPILMATVCAGLLVSTAREGKGKARKRKANGEDEL